ncbi:putative Signal sequence binding protein [Rhodotorula toruloides ATCC 204091]|uniref:Putative signal sequence binding protein n=1 Tax=Rhodotorula toruloides TaxID=5286 RepID=A0A0K3CK94_RHOTO|nr:putative Signal sequence binding protein [Rhodotorula toruloides ATCC 204091]KAK4334083.1 Vacuolar protein sorting/targeting protein VPS10 [Rhodotorula toruloides]PRQ72417.1 putative signal sequence binding protein [Rhodotorula toruloides]
MPSQHRRWRPPALLLPLVALVVLVLTSLVAASPEGPKPQLSHSLFDNLPSKITYFEDSPVVLYHDQIARDVYRSPNEGKEWHLVEGVPRGDAYMLIEHPYDKSIAFILSSSTTHYRTMNRGETWQSFVTALAPSLSSNTLSFHARKWDWILFAGQKCEDVGGWQGRVCHDETFYTKDAFASSPKPLLPYTTRCIFAHDKEEMAAYVPDELVYCAAYEPPSASQSSTSSTGSTLKDAISSLIGGAPRSLRESRLWSSTDWFEKERTYVDLGIGREAKGVVGIGGVQKYLVTALKPSLGGSSDDKGGAGEGSGEMVLYVTEDGSTWSRAQFPHGHGLRENAYTIVESTPHSILVDVNSSPSATAGTLFTSNSNGTYFVRSLENTNRNKNGIVDFERIVGIEGVAIVNTVRNVAEVEAGHEKDLKTMITFDDGGHWSLIKAPPVDHKGRKVKCDTDDVDSCSLHLHSVTQPHNYGRVFSSTAPGLVMGVGSIGSRLLPYDDCDAFVSTDAGLTWRMVDDGAKKYEFGDQGAVLVMVEDEEPTDELKYSFDYGKTWYEFDLGVKLRARLLTTVPDSTSLKFILLGTLTRNSKHKGSQGERHVIVYMDFESLGKRKCEDRDMEKWYARTIGGQPDCLMGHKQWFTRRKQDADCVVAEKWKDPVGREEDCPCDDEDYECDYNFAPDGMGGCTLVGPEPTPPGQCLRDGDKFMGSSGFRLIPGNTCDVKGGIKKDAKVEKPCHAGQETPGLVTHQSFTFPGYVIDHAYFGDSHTILAFTNKNRVWQSMNQGFSWHEAVSEANVLAMTMHGYARDRAYLITDSRTVHYTTDKGNSWNKFTAPADPNGLGIPLLDFHPLKADWLIWTGQINCGDNDSTTCRAVAYMTKDNGRNWSKLEEYVRVCSWGRDKKFRIDEKTVFCEAYRDKKGSQRAVYQNNNPLQLISGEFFYSHKTTLFDSIVGFATFENYMVVAETYENSRAIGLKVSMDGKTFALARFPPNMHLENQAYTVLESTTDSVFLHVTTHADVGSEWGTLFKSNSNGTYYGPSLEYVNRNGRGFVDFEKSIGLDGIAVVNIVSNPDEAALSSNKKLQTRITHNDGGRWKPLNPPAKDALGQAYECRGTNCALHIHGYTERDDPRATYSSPSATGVMLAVGNVGEHLISYTDSDTFLTRDGGFTWEEVHKDAHMWEFGDQGTILILANDEQPTDHVTYTLNQGLSWQDYSFGETIRVKSIVTVPMDTSRKFILFGTKPDRPEQTVAIHLDFSSITNIKCKLDLAHPSNDDFELWSPSENRDEPCLFGMQALYHRRIRDRNCFVGERLPQPHKIEKYCACTEQDFECEFNYKRNARGECVLVEGAQPLESDQTCAWDQPFWYERTSMRKVPHSKCVGGLQLDKGPAHVCPGHSRRGGFFWATIAVLPFGLAALAAFWWNRRRSGKGRIRLPEPGEPGRSGVVEFLVSVPWFLIGIVGVAIEKLRNIELPFVGRRNRRGGYRSLRLDMDAELLADYDDDEEL